MRSWLPLVLLLAPISAQAGTIVVFPPTATNVTPGEAMAAGQLLAEAFRNASNETVIGPQEAQQSLTGQTAEGAARALGADSYVESSITRLDRTGVLSADLVRIGGERRHRQMTLGSLDDMGPVSDRIARALLNNESVGSTESIDSVTDKDAEDIKRKKTDRISGFRIGMLAPVASGYQFDPGFEIMYDVRIESRWWFFQIAAGALFGIGGDHSALKYALLELGAAYYLTGGDFAPFIGGGLSPRLGGIDAFGFGLAPYATLGATLGRTSNAHFSFELRAAQNIVGQTVDVHEGPDNREVEKKAYPTELGAFIGIWW